MSLEYPNRLDICFKRQDVSSDNNSIKTIIEKNELTVSTVEGCTSPLVVNSFNDCENCSVYWDVNEGGMAIGR